VCPCYLARQYLPRFRPSFRTARESRSFPKSPQQHRINSVNSYYIKQYYSFQIFSSTSSATRFCPMFRNPRQGHCPNSFGHPESLPRVWKPGALQFFLEGSRTICGCPDRDCCIRCCVGFLLMYVSSCFPELTLTNTTCSLRTPRSDAKLYGRVGKLVSTTQLWMDIHMCKKFLVNSKPAKTLTLHHCGFRARYAKI
jgi:hypothetical protein